MPTLNAQPPVRQRGARPSSFHCRSPGPTGRKLPSPSTPATRARAAERSLAAAEGANGVGAPIEAALSLTLAGRALAQLGERDRALAELERAAAEFDRCGALRYRDEAERELGKLGHRKHRRTRRGQDRRERARVADGPRASGRATRRGPQDEPRDRRGAVPQQEDGRDASAQHLPQDGRFVARRAGARRRAGRSRRA